LIIFNFLWGFFQMFSKISSGILLGLVANGAVALADPNACTVAAAKICFESATVDVSADCVQNNGTTSEACAVSDRFASCVVTNEGQTLNLRYYNGTPVNPEENCIENGGVFVRD
jgi:hypothetical protein